MENFPKDPYILLSMVNMKLRDSFDSLDSLCDDLGVDPEELKDVLAKAGFNYDPETNRFA